MCLFDVWCDEIFAFLPDRAAQKQKRKPATLVISGFPDLLDKWEAEGADAGLQKPTEVPELLDTINRLVANR